ncbi:MAG: GNAT family N-acetyltransferase [Ruminococcus sp.]|nr:GNAT family N-acetyltransferase [Ruminococcus sp.]
MDIRIGTDADRRFILEKYPYTSQVMNQGGYLVVAYESHEILGFSWAFRRKISVSIDKTEDFVNVIEVFKDENRCKGIGSLIVQKCINIAKENGSYQIRAYCDANNQSSHMLWIKNGFAISPVKMENGQIVGSYVAYVL